MSQNNHKIIVAPSAVDGLGVLAIEDIVEGELIEICPVIIIPKAQVQVIHNTVLHDYYFLWGPEADKAAIALGFGSMYNHASDSNAKYAMDFEMETIDIYAVKDISAGEEVFINYNGSEGGKGVLWFNHNQ